MYHNKIGSRLSLPMKSSALYTSSLLTICCLLISVECDAQTLNNFYVSSDFETVSKVDSHVHIRSWDTAFAEQAKSIKIEFVNIAVHSDDPAEMHLRHETGFHQQEQNSQQFTIIASFPLSGWNTTEWISNTIDYIDKVKSRGARGLKVWKNIGMEFRDQGGTLIMIDHPKFRPVFDHMARVGLVLIGHLGEPKNCWLPLNQMTVNNDRNYFERHPEYHMFLHPEMPSYEQQMATRDRMLNQHSNLKFIGAHFGSIEWSVDELGLFLDRFPNASVDAAARIGQLQYQSQMDREKVQAFILRYQDRIIYGTDLTFAPPVASEALFASATQRWQRDWNYFCTDQSISVPELDSPVKGLKLPRSVVDKLYYRNAKRLFPEKALQIKE
jgi:predicted TIM-barrel fold metal-dependent hydrolase